MQKKVAVVTGASRGLGTELAIQLAGQGYTVVGVARSGPVDSRWLPLAEAGQLVEYVGDVAASDTSLLAFEQADRLGACDLLINCAGAGVFGPVGSYTRQDVDDCLAANLIGTILFSETAFKRFRETGGTIVNVMSTASQVARANEAVYCAAKWGARGYTESLRIEAKGTGVRIVAVYPGGMKTSFWESARGAQVDPSAFMDPADVAATILSALQDRPNAYVSDIIINRK